MNLDSLLALPRNIKKVIFVIHDAVVIFVAFWFAQNLKASYSQEWGRAGQLAGFCRPRPY